MFEVETGLWQAGLMDAKDWNAVCAERLVGAVWQLTEDLDDYPPVPESVFREKIMTPITDGESFDAAVLRKAWPVLVATAQRLALKRTLVMCGAGQNRSGLGCALILLARHRDLCGADAIDTVRRARGWSGVYGSFHEHQVLWNDVFVARLVAKFPRKTK